MFNSNLINFGALLDKFDIKVLGVVESKATKGDCLRERSQKFAQSQSHNTTQFSQTDSEDLKAITRSGQRLAATASLWLDKSDWD